MFPLAAVCSSGPDPVVTSVFQRNFFSFEPEIRDIVLHGLEIAARELPSTRDFENFKKTGSPESTGRFLNSRTTSVAAQFARLIVPAFDPDKPLATKGDVQGYFVKFYQLIANFSRQQIARQLEMLRAHEEECPLMSESLRKRRAPGAGLN